MKRRTKILIGVGAAFFAFLLAGTIFVGVQISGAPSVDAIDATPDGYLTTILDEDENTIDRLSGTESNRIYVDLTRIPEDLADAFVAIEDARFYQHNGIDVQGILRAIVKGVTTFHFSQGASTITQQLLKNNVFTDWMSEETFMDKVSRKIQEQYLAVQLEKKYSKQWILENYMNTINLGGGTRGVQVASQYYFGKDVSELSLAECALLAGITKNPSGYNPLLHPEASRERQELVLKAMKEQGYITEEEWAEALEEPVLEEISGIEHVVNGTQVFTWFEDALLNSLVEDLCWEKSMTEEAAWELIYSGGLTIYSTQNSDVQLICEETASDEELYPEGAEISIVVMDPADGSVKAIIGGQGKKEASLVYNRAVESLRQPGSTLKILGEYAAGIDQGLFTLGTVFDDAPYSYTDGTSIHNANGIYNGTTTIRRAIASSCNIVALKAYQQVGEDMVFSYLQSFGLSELTDADRNESLALGGTYGGVTNLQIAAAYNALAAGGSYVEPYYYTRVLDHDGNVLLEKTPASTRVVSADTAALLTSAMKDVLTTGTGTSAYFDGHSIAGKSGTTNENKDLWFAGYSPNFTCSVWGGYDDNQAQTNTTYVKEVWKAVMQRAHANYRYSDFSGTENLEQVKICRKCGNRALENVCDKTVQGNMTVNEYYAVGTAPTASCTCHVSVTICESSGKRAGSWCPEEQRKTEVYLREASEGTNDLDAVYSGEYESCDIHKYFWNQWFTTETEEESSQSTETESQNPWETSPGEGHPEEPGQGDHPDETGYGGEHEKETEKDDWDWFGWFR